MHHQDARAIRSLPPVLGVGAAEPPPQDGVVEAELPPHLRHLADVAEEIRQVADRHRRGEVTGDTVPENEVPYERLAADEKLVGHHVPRSDQDPPRSDCRAKARLLLRADFEVILEHDGLAVEMKMLERRIAVEQIEQAVDERDQPQPELLVRQIPFAIPVSVRDDVDVDHSA
jgi:hypothetical protein